MATVATKRKLSTKSIKGRYTALKEVEEGSSKSQVAMKCGIPKNTLSTSFFLLFVMFISFYKNTKIQNTFTNIILHKKFMKLKEEKYVYIKLQIF